VDRPVGTWLLLWPCIWSTALAAPAGGLPDVRLLALFALGSFAMRGAGCTINDMWDRDIDRQVERTRNRPLASGELSLGQAGAFLGAQLLIGLGVLTQLPLFTVAISLAAMPLVVAYPLAKRVTSWPQLVLGLTFNWGALVGWSAVRGDLPLEVVGPLYAGAVCWTLHYDTLYAYQDARDDKQIGVRSSALSLGGEVAGASDLRARAGLAIFALGATAGVGAAGSAVGLGAPLYAGLAVGGLGLGWQAATVPLSDRGACLAAFRQSQHYGLAVAAAIIAARLAQLPELGDVPLQPLPS
jgi:4-hydroxybenzoate polyprenyltransferase